MKINSCLVYSSAKTYFTFIWPPHRGLWVFHSCAHIEHFTTRSQNCLKTCCRRSTACSSLLSCRLPSDILFFIARMVVTASLLTNSITLYHRDKSRSLFHPPWSAGPPRRSRVVGDMQHLGRAMFLQLGFVFLERVRVPVTPLSDCGCQRQLLHSRWVENCKLI